MKNLAIGADIGGTHITTAVINLDTNEVLEETIAGRDVENSLDADSIIGKWAEAIKESISKSPNEVKGVGMAIPGPFDYMNGISEMEHKFQSIKDIDITPVLQEKLGLNLPVRYINDASAFAVGEAFTEEQKKFKKVMAITLGTGFGSAFIDEGRPIVEREDVPEMGCVWYVKYKEGIADDYFSTRWFVNTYKGRTGELVEGAKQIAEKYERDENAKAVFIEFGKNMAEFLAPILEKFGTESLIVGGNISRAFELIRPSFDASLRDRGIEISVNVSQLKEEAALVGSARLIDSEYYESVKEAIAGMK